MGSWRFLEIIRIKKRVQTSAFILFVRRRCFFWGGWGGGSGEFFWGKATAKKQNKNKTNKLKKREKMGIFRACCRRIGGGRIKLCFGR